MKIHLFNKKLNKDDNKLLPDGILTLYSKSVNLEVTSNNYKQLFKAYIKWCYQHHQESFTRLCINSNAFKKKDQYRYTTKDIKNTYLDSNKYFRLEGDLYFYAHYAKFQVLENAKDIFEILFKTKDFIFEVKNEETYEVLNEPEVFYEEGSSIKVLTNRYERNPKARKACLDYYGYSCVVCDFNFEHTYGEIGRDFIEVHHIKPLSEINQNYQVNPVVDLVPVCSNCHQMLHKKLPNASNPTISSLKSHFGHSNK